MKQKAIAQKKELPLQTLNTLRTIFNEKGWPFTGAFGEDYFNNFCLTLENFSEDQQNVIIALTKEFVWVQDMEYIRLFDSALSMFIDTLCKDKRQTIVLSPLLPKADVGKPKSSVALLYLVKCHLIPLQRKYKNHNIIMLDLPNDYSQQINQTLPPNSILCLVDDFIGSGETALSAIDYYLSLGATSENIVILSLVSMHSGLDRIQEHGYKVYTHRILEKAISDRKDGNATYYSNTMESIETQIKVREDCLFGFSHSEALVRMMRTPNNTFPVYWLKNKKNKFPPFAR